MDQLCQMQAAMASRRWATLVKTPETISAVVALHFYTTA